MCSRVYSVLTVTCDAYRFRKWVATINPMLCLVGTGHNNTTTLKLLVAKTMKYISRWHAPCVRKLVARIAQSDQEFADVIMLVRRRGRSTVVNSDAMTA